jgi:hypothetical protein
MLKPSTRATWKPKVTIRIAYTPAEATREDVAPRVHLFVPNSRAFGWPSQGRVSP